MRGITETSRLIIAAVMAVVFTFAIVCPAVQAKDDSLQDADVLAQLKALKAMVEAQNAKIQSQSIELNSLKQQGDWLNERRAEEVKAIIDGVLADADGRASLLSDGSTAGYDGSNFFLGSADGGFMMKIFGLFQGRWVGTFRGNEIGRTSTSPNDNDEMGFEFRRIELGFKGHIGDPRLGYTLVLATEDGAGGVEQIIAQDVVLSYALSDNVTLSGGRYFAPLLREELIGGGGSLAVALSYMNNELSIGRAEGISLAYETDSLRAQAFFNDGAGSGGGGGVNSPHTDAVDAALTVRADLKLAGLWSQWGDFSAWSDEPLAVFVGGAVHYQRGESGDAVVANDVDLLAWTIDGSIENDGVHLYFAAAGEHFEADTGADTDNYGFLVQLGSMVIPDKFEPFVRYEFIRFDGNLGFIANEVSLVTVGANYHLNKSAKIALDAVWAMDPVPTDSLNAGLLADGTKDDQFVVRAQVQLKF